MTRKNTHAFPVVTLPPIVSRERLGERYLPAVIAMRWPAMLTLNRPSYHGRALPLARLRETMRAFARLRRTKSFAPVKGGIAALDVTRKLYYWHDHIHAIIDVEWIELPPLIAAWKRTIGDKATLHLQRLNRPALAIAYVTRLISTPADAPAQVEALHRILSDPYLTTSWGSCHRSRIPAPLSEA